MYYLTQVMECSEAFQLMMDTAETVIVAQVEST
ncbi:Hypothetical protein TART1_0042 [Trichococcus shcherbakoviae]|uniref:Uncharacterized protein n=1 Tax=Trichococcus shcherbakoviae TaxID=2094020 RepID=A0A383TCA9_9LACT|nr:Hypothetical protein TART1_0042 [Trichococcus shcherbakoviae]